ncbi:MAG: vWA domain-containing protein, partial [Planctomycetaceae bacterium]
MAIALRLSAPAAKVSRHILLVDTSASQAGVYRQRTLQAVQALLQGLPQGSQVKLVAADSAVSVMTPDFVAPDSPELASAVSRLSLRTPLGATDLAAALRSSLQGVSESAVSVAYIGDGMSTGDLLSGKDLAGLVTDLQAAGAAFHALLLGPATDAHLTGILANQTGGSLLQLPNDNVSAVAS